MYYSDPRREGYGMGMESMTRLDQLSHVISSTLAATPDTVSLGDGFGVLVVGGCLLSFGTNVATALGLPGIEAALVPLRVKGISGVVERAACGRHYTIVVNSDKQVYGFGLNYGQMGMDPSCPVPRSHAEDVHSDYMQRYMYPKAQTIHRPEAPADPKDSYCIHRPMRLRGLEQGVRPEPREGAEGEGGRRSVSATHHPDYVSPSKQTSTPVHVEGIACGQRFVCTLLSTGAVCMHGHIPIQGMSSLSIPTGVTLPLPCGASLVKAGARHAVVVAGTTGEIYAVGDNSKGQLGLVHTKMVPMSEACMEAVPVSLNRAKIVYVACGYDHTIIVDSRGCCYAFGSNDHGQCGPNARGKAVSGPVSCGVSVAAVAAGAYYSCVFTKKGDSFVFGLFNGTHYPTPTSLGLVVPHNGGLTGGTDAIAVIGRATSGVDLGVSAVGGPRDSVGGRSSVVGLASTFVSARFAGSGESGMTGEDTSDVDSERDTPSLNVSRPRPTRLQRDVDMSWLTGCSESDTFHSDDDVGVEGSMGSEHMEGSETARSDMSDVTPHMDMDIGIDMGMGMEEVCLSESESDGSDLCPPVPASPLAPASPAVPSSLRGLFTDSLQDHADSPYAASFGSPMGASYGMGSMSMGHGVGIPSFDAGVHEAVGMDVFGVAPDDNRARAEWQRQRERDMRDEYDGAEDGDSCGSLRHRRQTSTGAHSLERQPSQGGMHQYPDHQSQGALSIGSLNSMPPSAMGQGGAGGGDVDMASLGSTALVDRLFHRGQASASRHTGETISKAESDRLQAGMATRIQEAETDASIRRESQERMHQLRMEEERERLRLARVERDGRVCVLDQMYRAEAASARLHLDRQDRLTRHRESEAALTRLMAAPTKARQTQRAQSAHPPIPSAAYRWIQAERYLLLQHIEQLKTQCDKVEIAHMNTVRDATQAVVGKLERQIEHTQQCVAEYTLRERCANEAVSSREEANRKLHTTLGVMIGFGDDNVRDQQVALFEACAMESATSKAPTDTHLDETSGLRQAIGGVLDVYTAQRDGINAVRQELDALLQEKIALTARIQEQAGGLG
ncbi:hypothetical protein KIPB_001330 [Kipferlia bialata]|uniref:Regulator of chromosome condensation 1/beta-lactamase-inhibitor protein II n=1 Tax=Kipferlia bialata TaxID=797122 RepID=A0A9K3GE24_9EUKA|nr:hypothetical protein KIPB_001330 [Kipferlia bialata]|eukprot:g1330.t1